MVAQNYWKDWSVKSREKLIKDFGGQCNNWECGSKEKLEFAHILPTGLKGEGRGKAWRLKDVKENPKSYLLLCHDCHQAFDRDELFLPEVVKSWLS